MKLRLEFGFPVTKKLEIGFYAGDVQNYHSVVKYDDRYWEFILFDKDPNQIVDYILTYGEFNPLSGIPSQFYDLDFHYGSNVYSSNARCECGALYQRGFENFHSFWCPKWEKV